MKWSVIVVTLGLAVAPLSAYASANLPSGDTLIEGAKLCTRHLPHYEREYAIPTHLLSAIASTESGRYHEGLGLKLPWPWAINVEGKGYFYENKQQAIAAVKKFKANGRKSIDVGCMQVNINQHPHAFSSLEEAFEPQTNIAYAAGFLRDLYAEEGTWKKAAADYHSRTPSLGRQYVNLVYTSWYDIITKLRAARLQVPESSIVAMNELKGSVSSKNIHSASAKPKVISASTTALPEQQGRQVASYATPHMNVIHVSSQPAQMAQNTSQNNLIVIHPPTAHTPIATKNPEPITEAANTPLPMAPVAAPTVLHVNDQLTAATLAPSAGHKSGPTFIFND